MWDKTWSRFRSLVFAIAAAGCTVLCAHGGELKESIYAVGELAPRDSVAKLKVGDAAPAFTLQSVAHGGVSLQQYLGERNVVVSFVPAAWTPVCSTQWPMYNGAKDVFEKNDAVLLGITVDNVPTLYAWTKQLSKDSGPLWFPVLSDFFPHGKVAEEYGVLRSDGVSERALFLVDKKGVIRYVEVMDINRLPHFSRLANALDELD
jgi:peroxiredoxin (alkyl hydroperoxide reductase subunit C)